MKNLCLTTILLIGLAGGTFVGCDDSESDRANDPPIEGTLLGEGSFTGVNGYSASGTVSIIEDTAGRLRIRLEKNFQVSGGNLDIYISGGPDVVSESVRLAELKATAGAQNYTASETTTLGDFTHVIIFCTDFDVEFGYAEITETSAAENE